MKLLYCRYCGDIFNMGYKRKECSCKKTSGLYITQEKSVYSGKYAVCLGVNNYSLKEGIINVPLDGKGVSLDAYVIPYYCDSTIKVRSTKKYASATNFKKYLAIKSWDKQIDNIRIRNPFLKIIYKIFKKYIFISVPE